MLLRRMFSTDWVGFNYRCLQVLTETPCEHLIRHTYFITINGFMHLPQASITLADFGSPVFCTDRMLIM